MQNIRGKNLLALKNKRNNLSWCHFVSPCLCSPSAGKCLTKEKKGTDIISTPDLFKTVQECLSCCDCYLLSLFILHCRSRSCFPSLLQFLQFLPILSLLSSCRSFLLIWLLHLLRLGHPGRHRRRDVHLKRHFLLAILSRTSICSLYICTT